MLEQENRRPYLASPALGVSSAWPALGLSRTWPLLYSAFPARDHNQRLVSVSGTRPLQRSVSKLHDCNPQPLQRSVTPDLHISVTRPHTSCQALNLRRSAPPFPPPSCWPLALLISGAEPLQRSASPALGRSRSPYLRHSSCPALTTCSAQPFASLFPNARTLQ